MVKFIVLAIIALAAFVSRFWFNQKVSSGTDSHANGLKKGKFDVDSFSDVFNINLENKFYGDLLPGFNGFGDTGSWEKMKFDGKYKILTASARGHERAVIIAKAITKQTTQYSSDNMEMILPCSLLVVNDEDSKTLKYFTEFPTDGHHDSLLRDFINQVNGRLIGKI